MTIPDLMISQLPIVGAVRCNRHALISRMRSNPPQCILTANDSCLTSPLHERHAIRHLIWPRAISLLDKRFKAGHPVFRDVTRCISVPGSWPAHIAAVTNMLADRHGVEIATPALRSKLERAVCWFDAQFETLMPKGLRHPKGMGEFLRHSHDQGARFGLVSNALRAYPLVCINRLKAAHLFKHDHIVCADDVERARESWSEIRPKPHPDPWLLCLRQIKAGFKEHILIIEENYQNGILALNEILSAGYHFVTLVIVTNDGRSFDETAREISRFLRREILKARDGKSELVRFGFRGDIGEHILIVDSFERLLQAA